MLQLYIHCWSGDLDFWRIVVLKIEKMKSRQPMEDYEDAEREGCFTEK